MLICVFESRGLAELSQKLNLANLIVLKKQINLFAESWDLTYRISYVLRVVWKTAFQFIKSFVIEYLCVCLVCLSLYEMVTGAKMVPYHWYTDQSFALFIVCFIIILPLSIPKEISVQKYTRCSTRGDFLNSPLLNGSSQLIIV